MRKISKLLVFMFIFTLVLPSFAFAKDTAKVAKILDLSGDVQVKKGGGEKLFNAFKNMALTQGDTVITGKDGKVTIELDKDKEVVMGSDTQLLISELVSSIKAESGKTSLNLLGGKVKVTIKEKLKGDSKFVLKTPTTVMGVRGTSFYVNVDPETGRTYLGVFEGVVAAGTVSATGEDPGEEATLIEENQQLVVDPEAEGDLTPEPLNVEQMDSFGLEQFIEEIKNNPSSEIDEKELEELQALREQKRMEEEMQRQQREERQQQAQRNHHVSYDTPDAPQEQTPIVFDPDPIIPSPPVDGIPRIDTTKTIRIEPSNFSYLYVISIPFTSEIEVNADNFSMLFSMNGIVFTHEIDFEQVYVDDSSPTELKILIGNDALFYNNKNVIKIAPGVIKNKLTGKTNTEPLFTGYFGEGEEHFFEDFYMTLYWENTEQGYQVLPFVPRLTGIQQMSYQYSFYNYDEYNWEISEPVFIDSNLYRFNPVNGELEISNVLVKEFIDLYIDMMEQNQYIDIQMNIQFINEDIEHTFYIIVEEKLKLVGAEYFVNEDIIEIEFSMPIETEQYVNNLQNAFEISDGFFSVPLTVFDPLATAQINGNDNSKMTIYLNQKIGENIYFILDEYSIFGRGINLSFLSEDLVIIPKNRINGMESVLISLNEISDSILPIGFLPKNKILKNIKYVTNSSDSIELVGTDLRDSGNDWQYWVDVNPYSGYTHGVEINLANVLREWVDKEYIRLDFTFNDSVRSIFVQDLPVYGDISVTTTVTSDVYNEVEIHFSNYIKRNDTLYDLSTSVWLTTDGKVRIPISDIGQAYLDGNILRIYLYEPLVGDENQFIIDAGTFMDIEIPRIWYPRIVTEKLSGASGAPIIKTYKSAYGPTNLYLLDESVLQIIINGYNDENLVTTLQREPIHTRHDFFEHQSKITIFNHVLTFGFNLSNSLYTNYTHVEIKLIFADNSEASVWVEMVYY